MKVRNFFKVIISIVLVFSVFFSCPIVACADDGEEEHSYTLSSEYYVHPFATMNVRFASGSTSYVNYSVYPFNNITLSDGVSVVSGSLTMYGAVASSAVSVTPSVSRGSLSYPSSSSLTWAQSSYKFVRFAFSGSVVFSYPDFRFLLSTSDAFSIAPTGVSDSFIVSLSGVSVSPSFGFSGTVSAVDSSVVSCSGTGSFSPEWLSAGGSQYYLKGSDSGYIYGPFVYGQEYPLSDVASWQTESFYLCHYVSLFSGRSTLSLSVGSGTAFGNLTTVVSSYSPSIVVPVSTFDIMVSNPKDKTIPEYLQEIEDKQDEQMWGYDNSSNNDMLNNKNQELADYEAAQDAAFDTANSYVTDYHKNFDPVQFVSLASSFALIQRWFTLLWNGIGPFTPILSISLTLCVAGFILKLKKG